MIPHLADRLASLCRELRLSRPVRLCESALVEVPTVVGWLRPVILLPAGALLGLSPPQLETILAHELAHIRRFDSLVSLGQAVAETLLFYHPAVWWVSHRMRIEREHCCDDVAVAICGDAVSYARALTRLAQGRPSPPILALAATGGSLFQRISRLVGQPPPEASRRARGVAAAVVLSSLMALGLSAAVSAHRPEDPATAAPRNPTPPARELPAPGPAAPAVDSREPADSGASVVPLGKVIALADAGVTAEYIDQMAALGFPGLSPNKLLDLCSEGIDPDFVRDMKTATAQDLSLTDLVALHGAGVTADLVTELAALGHENLSVARLVGLAGAGVTGEYAREMKELLADESLSLPLLIEMQNHGVSTDFVKEMKDLGYGGLSAQALIELVNNGVDSGYVRDLKDAGYAKLAPKDLVELRSHGVEIDLLQRLAATRQESAR
jgi:BlaR1 peptidase M56